MKYESKFKEKNLKIMKAEAYWISPKGRILAVTDKHIGEIVKNPKAFGLTVEQIEAIYKEHGEVVGTEGNARERLIVDLVNSGWIRARNYIRQGRWTVNIPRLNNKTMDYIKYFAEEMIKVGWSKWDEVLIDSTGFRKTFSMNDLAKDILYMEEKKEIKRTRYGLRYVKKYNEKELVKPYIYLKE